MRQSGWEKLLLDDLNKLVELSKPETAISPTTVSLKAGERRYVTVLFLDMKGFTALSEKLDHETVDAVIGKLFAVFKNHIENRGGWVEKFEGDAILAAFGAEIAHEDDAARAVDSALAMLDTFQSLRPALEREGIRTGLRIGIHSGEVTRGRRGGYDVITGDTVNAAARLEQNAETNTVLVSSVTRNLAGHPFVYQKRADVEAKGKSKPIEACVVTGKCAPKDRWERSQLALRTRFAGRRDELEMLSESLRQCQSPPAESAPGVPESPVRHTLVCIEGEPGIGKSRLGHEFILRSTEAGAVEDRSPGAQLRTVLKGAASSFASRPYEMVISMLMKMMQVTVLDAEAKRRFEELVKDAAEALPDPSTLKKSLPVLGFILGLQYKDPRLEYLDPKKLQTEILIAFREFIEGLARKAFKENRKTLILVCEDYQWVDEPTNAMMEFVLSNARTPLPLLFVATCRPGAALPSVPSRNARTVSIPLHPLSDDDEATLIRNILGEANVQREVIDLVRKRSAGNPYFMEELIFHLVDYGRITKRNGEWAFESAARAPDLPVSLRSLILSRIDALPRPMKATLQSASVLGCEFMPATLEWIHDRLTDMPVARPQLEELAVLSFLISPPAPGEPYAFKHILTRDVAYETLLHHNRRILHRLAADYIEEHHPGNLEPYYYELAENRLAAGEPEKATEYYVKAGEKAQRSHDNKAAVAAYSQALELLPDADPLKCKTFRERGNVQAFTGRMALAKEDYDRSLALAKSQGNPAEECISLYCLGAFYVVQSRHWEAVAHLSEALEASRQIGDRTREAQVLQCLGIISQDQNDFGKALSRYEQALAIGTEIQDRRMRAGLLCQIGDVHRKQSRYAKALECFQQALSINNEIGDRLGAATSMEQMGAFCLNQTQYEKALDYFTQALEIKKETGDRRGEAQLALQIGKVHLMKHQHGAALECYEHALTLSRESGFRQIEGTAIYFIGNVRLEIGQYKEALEDYRKVLELDESAPVGVVKAIVIHTVGTVYRMMGQYEQALRCQEQGLKAFDEMGNEVGRRVTWVEIGKIHRDLGRYDEAQEFLHRSQNACEEASRQLQMIWQCPSWRHLGEIELSKGRYEEALECFRNALDCAREMKDLSEESESLCCVADLYYLRSEFGEALEYCGKAVAVCDTLGLHNRSLPIKSMQARVLSSLGRHEEAVALSGQVVEWLEKNEPALGYRILKPEQLLFTHFLVLQNAGTSDSERYLEAAYTILHEHTRKIADEGHRANVLNEPPNKPIVDRWRRRTGKK